MSPSQTPTSPEWPFKSKGPNPEELSGCWWTCPQHKLVTLQSPGEPFDGFGASYTFRISQPAQKGKLEHLQQWGRAGHLLPAGIAQLLQALFCNKPSEVTHS